MKKTIFRLSLIMLLLLLALPLTYAAAQDEQQLTTVVDVSNGYVISVPDGWDVEEDDQTGGFTLSNDEMTIFVLNPLQVIELVDVADDTELDDLLIDLYDELYGERPRRRDIEAIEIDGREAVSWSYQDGRFDGIFYIVRLSDNTLGAVDAYSEEVDIEDVSELVTAIVTSFDVGAEGQVVSSNEPAEPCFVSTDEENSVQLRVGPGSNRSVIAFLDAGEEFQVTGRFTADDDSVWYQLDKDEVLPGTGANEVWVAAADVDEAGDCAAVVDASAPPIIPGQTQPPVTTDNPDDSTDSGTTATIVPLAGRWTATMASTTTASCTGTQTVTFDSSEVFPDGLSFTVSISSVAADGSSLVLDGERFILQGNGFYIGPSLFNLIDLDNAQTYVRAISPTTMVGTVVANITINSRGCSQTTEITLTRG